MRDALRGEASLEPVEVRLLPDVTAAWDEYVLSHPQASNYHQAKWKTVIEEGFAHKARYLLATRRERIVGILPLVVMRSLLFRRFLVSLPFVNYGGILADDDESERALLTSAQRVAAEEGAEFIELRHVVPHGHGLRAKRHKVTLILDLEKNAETQWKTFDPKVRNQIRKAEKSALWVQSGGAEFLDDFYAVFARNMRDLGTPVYGKRFFQAIVTQFPSSTRVFVVRLREHAVAAGLACMFKDTIEMPWAASVKEQRNLCGNMLLYWEAIRFGIKQGFKKFDFGRCTPDEGPYKFKEQWGARPTPLAWEYWTPEARALPDLSPANPKYGPAIQIWRRLPLRIANYLGPSIVRNIP